MAVTDDEVKAWLGQNTGATTQQIADKMQEYNVGWGQISRATGLGQGEVQFKAAKDGVSLSQRNALSAIDGNTVMPKSVAAKSAPIAATSYATPQQATTQPGYGGILSAPKATPSVSQPATAPVSQDEIKNYLAQYNGDYSATNLSKIANDAIKYGVSANQLADATGFSAQEITKAFAGLGNSDVTAYFSGGRNGGGLNGGSPGGVGGGFGAGGGGMLGNGQMIDGAPVQKLPGVGDGTFNPYSDTTLGQVNSMLQQDSEYLQNARTGAMQQANARGLLNSSIAASAGEKAAIDAAALIGDATANQYQKAKLTTEQLQSSMDVAQLSADTQKRIADLNASVSRDNAQLSADTANTSSALSSYRSIADSTNQQINAILTSPSLTPEAKQQAIDSTLMRHDEYLAFSDAITGYELSSMITYE